SSKRVTITVSEELRRAVTKLGRNCAYLSGTSHRQKPPVEGFARRQLSHGWRIWRASRSLHPAVLSLVCTKKRV
ncbi:MAG: hypothetical protein M0T74_07245, partial [Desulfitobacterium hafniense]|nr:hypothetical protein [Desulfitobacterium hafniense]